MLLAMAKCRDIGAEGHCNHDRVPRALAVEITRKGLSKPGRLDANNWIGLRVETFATPESLYTDRVTLDVLGVAAERRVHDKAEKGDELGRTEEAAAGNNTLQSGANLILRRCVGAVFHNLHGPGLWLEAAATSHYSDKSGAH